MRSCVFSLLTTAMCWTMNCVREVRVGYFFLIMRIATQYTAVQAKHRQTIFRQEDQLNLMRFTLFQSTFIDLKSGVLYDRKTQAVGFHFHHISSWDIHSLEARGITPFDMVIRLTQNSSRNRTGKLYSICFMKQLIVRESWTELIKVSKDGDELL